jgi:hypothetical protein
MNHGLTRMQRMNANSIREYPLHPCQSVVQLRTLFMFNLC